MDMGFQLNETQQDVLRELGNIGAGHAATALSILLREEVRMSVTSARLCAFDEISDVVGGAEEIVAGVFLRMSGDVYGNMFLLLSLKSARQLLHRLVQVEDEIEDFTEMDISALSEVGNIMGGSYLNAMSELSSLQMNQSVPAVAIDMAGAILDIGLFMSGEIYDSAILIDTCIWQGKDNIDGHFFLLPDPGSTEKLLHALGC